MPLLRCSGFVAETGALVLEEVQVPIALMDLFGMRSGATGFTELYMTVECQLGLFPECFCQRGPALSAGPR